MKGFLPIPEYPEYLISPKGEVFSTKSNKILTNRVGTHGYWYIKVCYNNKTKDVLIHRALCRVYKDLPSLYSDLEVDHKDRNKLNIDLENLQVLSKEAHKIKTITERGLVVNDNKCPSCGKEILNRNKTCFNCRPKENPEITAEQIEYWVIKFSWVRASKELGLTDNGLKKRYKSLTGKDPKSIKKIGV